MASEVAKNITRFDADGDGRLTLSELLRMLTVKPWRDLMLPSVAHEMQFELLRMHKTEDKSNPVVVAIKDIFSRADVDGDQAVDQFELAAVFKQAVSQGLLPARYDNEMSSLQEARSAINRFSTDGGHTLNHADFTAMIGSKPWVNLLPRNIKDELLLLGAASRSESPPRPRIRSTPVKTAFALALDLFEAADADSNGVLDSVNLAVLSCCIAAGANDVRMNTGGACCCTKEAVYADWQEAECRTADEDCGACARGNG